MQDPRTFEAILVGEMATATLDPGRRRLLVHNVVSHLVPNGWVVTPCQQTAESIGADLLATGMERYPTGDEHHCWRRDARRTIHDLVADARSRIIRWTPEALRARLDDADPTTRPLILDTRTLTDRERHGVIPGSIHTPRTVLEWRVDPASGYSAPEVDSFDQTLVVVCSGGYSSSLAAATLVDLGFANAGDLIGGIDAWRRAGFDLIPPTDHCTEEPL